MTRLNVIVHDFRHVRAVFKTTEETPFFPVLITAPQVVAALGASAAVMMIREAAVDTGMSPDHFECIFDVQNNIGAALALIRTPQTTVCLSAVPQTAYARLNALAHATNSTLLTKPPQADIDLGQHFHWESACKNVLEAKQRKR